MNMLRSFFVLLLAGVLAGTLTACDQSEQNFELQEGDQLAVNGPSAATIPNYDSTAYVEADANPSVSVESDTAQYFVRAFTVNQDYSWSVNGATEVGTRRDGEYYMVNPPDVPASYSVSVSTTIDGQDYSQSFGTAVDYPTLGEQLSKRSKAILPQLLSSAGLASPLNSDANDDDDPIGGYTIFTPTDEAFLGALDDDGSGQIDSDELPEAGIVADILRYHVLPGDSLTASDLTDGAAIPTALPEEVVSVSTVGGVTVNGSATSATVTEADVATSDGVAHQIDGVLLPDALVSAKNQSAARGGTGDTIEVAGSYVADGGFVVAHDSTSLADGNVAGSVVGNSFYLEPGFERSITIITDEQLDAEAGESVTLTFMMHRDTDDDQTYDFNTSGGSDDGPYVTSDGTPVVENATITIPE